MKIPRPIRLLFEAWGYVSFLGTVGIVALVAWSFFAPANTSPLSAKEAGVFLNQSGLGQAVFEDVLHSYRSPTSGVEMDYANAYAIKITGPPSEVLRPDDGRKGREWESFPLTNPILEDALSLALSIRPTDDQPWIPSLSDLASPRFMAMFWKLTYYSTHSEYVSLFLLDTQENIVYVLQHKI